MCCLPVLMVCIKPKLPLITILTSSHLPSTHLLQNKEHKAFVLDEVARAYRIPTGGRRTCAKVLKSTPYGCRALDIRFTFSFPGACFVLVLVVVVVVVVLWAIETTKVQRSRSSKRRDYYHKKTIPARIPGAQPMDLS